MLHNQFLRMVMINCLNVCEECKSFRVDCKLTQVWLIIFDIINAQRNEYKGKQDAVKYKLGGKNCQAQEDVSQTDKCGFELY